MNRNVILIAMLLSMSFCLVSTATASFLGNAWMTVKILSADKTAVKDAKTGQLTVKATFAVTKFKPGPGMDSFEDLYAKKVFTASIIVDSKKAAKRIKAGKQVKLSYELMTGFRKNELGVVVDFSQETWYLLK